MEWGWSIFYSKMIFELENMTFFFKFFLTVSSIYKFYMKSKLIGLVICINSFKFKITEKIWILSTKSMKWNLVRFG